MQQIKNYLRCASSKNPEDVKKYFVQRFQDAKTTIAQAQVLAAYSIFNRRMPDFPNPVIESLARSYVEQMAKGHSPNPTPIKGTQWPSCGQLDSVSKQWRDYREKNAVIFKAPKYIKPSNNTVPRFAQESAYSRMFKN